MQPFYVFVDRYRYAILATLLWSAFIVGALDPWCVIYDSSECEQVWESDSETLRFLALLIVPPLVIWAIAVSMAKHTRKTSKSN
jgi:hypothetical protein